MASSETETPRKAKKKQTTYVEEILEHRKNEEGEDEYLVKWFGDDPKYNSWESKEFFTDDIKIQEFERRRAEMQVKQEDPLTTGTQSASGKLNITMEADGIANPKDDEGNAAARLKNANQPKYIIQRHDKPEILEIVGIKSGDNDTFGGRRELEALVTYVDNTFEYVPTNVLQEFAPAHLIKYYEKKLIAQFTHMQPNVKEVESGLAESEPAVIQSTFSVNLPNSDAN
uniref:Chromo domain-containing protein n=1 Tax=Acrobeloides nanus TaxID=290746 RepID=A0A914DDM4_9BILA